jgi:small subunit ribosomal protein S20
MATHRSAEKRARQALKRRARNRKAKSHVRTLLKTARGAIASGDSEGARQKLRSAERALRMAASKGAIKKTTASRSVSRLAKAVHRTGS